MEKKQYFGTDGIRGLVGGEVMNPAFMLRLGSAIATVLKASSTKRPVVVIGCDTRLSADMIQSALTSGLLSCGCDVFLLGVLPTPAIAYFTQALKATAGIVVSASHNPYRDNGVKCIGAEGMKLPDSWEIEVEKNMQEVAPLISQQSIGRVALVEDARAQYIEHCKTLISPRLDLSNCRIVLDCANGAASYIAPTLFQSLGAKVTTIHAKPNGININEHCGATDTTSLKEAVLADQADCGLAFDGDADRIMMVDHQGALVDGDEILGILATHQVTDVRPYEGVVGTLMTNLGLEKALQSRGISFERAAVGDRYVLSAMKARGWRLGGEASGHIINLDYSSTGDGIVTGLQILKVICDTGQSLNQLKSVVKKRPQILINVPVQKPKSYSEFEEISEAVAKTQALLGSLGRVLLRASGTESCVRVMVEGDDKSVCQEQAEHLAAVVQAAYAKRGLLI